MDQLRRTAGALLLGFVLLPLSAQTLLWETALPSAAVTPPVIGGRGTVYIACEDKVLRAYNGSGSLAWEFTLQKAPSGPMALLSNVLYVPTLQSALQAVDVSGNGLWEFPLTPRIIGAPAIGPEGEAYFVTEEKQLHCVSGNGAWRWSAALPGEARQGPVLGKGGTLFVACRDLLLAFGPTGARRWEYQISGNAFAPLALGPSNQVLVVDGTGVLHAVSASGAQLWTKEVGVVSVSPVISADMVYVVTPGPTLKSYSLADGGDGWTYAGGGSAPALSNDSTLYLPDDRATAPAVPSLKALDTSSDAGTNRLKKKVDLGAKALDLAIAGFGPGGRLAVVTRDGRILCFSVTAGPAEAPWSQSGATSRRQSRRDDSPTSVSILGDLQDEPLSGEVELAAEVQDDLPADLSVLYYVDGGFVGAGHLPPYSFPWNTEGTLDGTRTLTAEAVDLAGNSKTESLEVEVSNGSSEPVLFYPDDPPYTFTWDPGEGTRFWVECAEDPGFTIRLASSRGQKKWLDTASWTPSAGAWRKILSVASEELEDDTPGYYRVWQKDAGTIASGEFAVAAPAGATLVSPADGAEVSPASPPAFDWAPYHSGKFRVEFSANEDFAGGAAVTSQTEAKPWLTAPVWTPSPGRWSAVVTLGNTVYWRVLSRDSIGREALSEIRSLLIE